MKLFQLLHVVLNLFDGGPAAGSGDAAGGNQGETTASSGSTRRGKPGDLSQVVYGKQPQGTTPSADAGQGQQTSRQDIQTTSDAAEARRKAYRDLVNGEYKDLYTEDTQGMINRRFRETKTLEQQVRSQQPIMDMLFSRYHITDGDISKLQRAIDADDAYWEEEAEAAGLTVPQYKEVQRLKRENEQMRQAQMQRGREAAAQAKLAQWTQEAEAMRSLYPGFDLNREAQNREFLSMLQAGVPVQHAYEVCHLEDIKRGVASMQARATEQQVVANVRARGRRPAENGASAQSGFVAKTDVTKLTKADRAEIARRASRGEIISF